MNTSSESILKRIKNTVGYSEAVDKQSFITGATVALSLAEVSHSALESHLNQELTAEKKRHQRVRSDLETLASIIKTYSND